MVNIAIVEDEDPAARVLEEFLKRSEREHGGTASNVSRYRDAETFLSDVAVGGYGIVLMDIELPDMNGMEASKRLQVGGQAS